MKPKSKIDPQAWYTLQDIVKGRMFPWATSFWKVRNVVALDRRSRNVLKAHITGTGRATKYHFEGANIQKFIDGYVETRPWLVKNKTKK